MHMNACGEEIVDTEVGHQDGEEREKYEEVVSCW